MPVIVTSLTGPEVAADMEQTERLGGLVVTKEDVAETIKTSRSMQILPINNFNKLRT